MREYWILTKLQLSSLFGINKIIHMKDAAAVKQGKKSLSALIIMVLAIGYVAVLYSMLLIDAFIAIGAPEALLGLMAMAACSLVLLFSVFETKSVLLGFGDYDTVMSWPVSVRAVAASRVTSMYAYNLAYAALFLVPVGVVYALKTAPVWSFYPLYIVLLLFVPALPTIIGAALGTLVAAATARMKKRNLFSSVGQIMLVAAVMVLSMRLNSGMDGLSSQAAASLGNIVKSAYPPAMWFQDAVVNADALSALLLIFTALAAAALMVVIVSTFFVRLNSLLKATPQSGRFVMRAQKRTSSVFALFKRELSRYFASSAYVTNTIFGYVLLLAAAAFCLIKSDLMRSILDDPSLQYARTLPPFLTGWIVSMSATTSSSISMEGKQLWIAKSLPITARDWLLSKLMVSLALAVPSILIGCTLIGVGIRASAGEFFWLLCITLLYALAFGIFGLWINIRMPKLDWRTDIEVVKQSMATMIVVFSGMGAAAIPAVLFLITGSTLVLPITAGVLLVLSALMWRSLMTSGERRLYRL